ncbi:SPOR domain-containing protein [Streptomyces sp. WMMB 322]|uniref:SPOR domain-containing protein n=1 Tax=Streptomyces sp. WMMB 322 TaxID=1286821 RepID=UPI0006E280AE|nr:SPOR domain-containing protein [Streptomyces sp. WMMB 322]SCK32495.1 Sporulation related domain-containing protein [Streptomyces sp. WMMB 322]
MRSVSGDGETVLPWQVIREDGHGNRYRVGSYATRTEAQQVADRLGRTGGRAKGGGGGDGSYLVEPLECASGECA